MIDYECRKMFHFFRQNYFKLHDPKAFRKTIQFQSNLRGVFLNNSVDVTHKLYLKARVIICVHSLCAQIPLDSWRMRNRQYLKKFKQKYAVRNQLVNSNETIFNPMFFDWLILDAMKIFQSMHGHVFCRWSYKNSVRKKNMKE